MTIITLTAEDQALALVTAPIVAAGDRKSLSISVAFSAEWDGFAKSAVFFTETDPDKVYEVILDKGACIVPHEAVDEADNLFIGVRGVMADSGTVKTSTLVKYVLNPGARSGNETTTDPSPDVYQQLLTAYDQMHGRLDVLNGQKYEGGITVETLTFTPNASCTCDGVKVYTNGINALIEVANLKWTSSANGWWNLADLPEALAPFANFDDSSANRLQLYCDDATTAKFAIKNNTLQIYVGNASTLQQAGAFNLQLPYALRYPSLDEITDMRVGANGKTYETAGAAMRDQFLRMYDNISAVRAELENLEEQIPEGEVTADGWEFRGITFDDVQKDTAIYMYADWTGKTLTECCNFASHEGHSLYSAPVKKGDVFVPSNAFALRSDYTGVIITGSDGIIVDHISVEDLAEGYTFQQDGGVAFCFDHTQIQSAEFFYIKSPSPNQPLVLDAADAEKYQNDATYGDAAMDAIMTGRPIMVRTPNVQAGGHVVNLSPIYMHQLPNYQNDFLYLFYLRDEKQTIDLSAMGLGVIQVPVHGELKLRLSRTYNACPL